MEAGEAGKAGAGCKVGQERRVGEKLGVRPASGTQTVTVKSREGRSALPGRHHETSLEKVLVFVVAM